MKVRIKGNSVRFRLSKSEVEVFAKEGYVEERTEFVNSTLIYSVKRTDADNLSVDYAIGSLTLFVPVTLLNSWATTNQVALSYTMPVNNTKSLFILLEKDFKCLDANLTEDQSDFFENPSKFC